MLFGWFGNVRKGKNIILTVLFFFLWMLKTSSDLQAAASSTLYLQVDGGSENMNRLHQCMHRHHLSV
jgi:hypothetical protein